MSGSARTSAASGRSAAPGVRGSFLTLFNVRFQHDYYNASRGSCPDFAVTPSPDCAQLMASLGVVFRDFGAGFAVAIDQARIPALIAYLGAHYSSGTPGTGYWTRLTFVLRTTNPGFVGITRLPITTNPMVQNLYASNLQTRTVKGQILLGGTLTPNQSLYPLSGTTLTVATPSGSSATLTDISGAAVAVPTTSNGATTSFTMSGLPYGLYTIVSSQPTRRKSRAHAAPSAHLRVSDAPSSFALIDLLLTQPVPGEGDAAAFPVAPMPAPASGTPAIQSVVLTLPFQARETYWNYYICSHDRAGGFSPGLEISGTGTTFAKSVEPLPNGDSAVLFAAADALPLRQLSPYRFQLAGKRQGSNGGRDSIALPWLPAAAASPVWPAAGEPLAGRSEIYVYV